MARSYKRRGARGRGLLTREAAVQLGVQTNSLYCISATTRVDGSGDTEGRATVFFKKGNEALSLNADETGICVRVASLIVSSQAPFEVQLRTLIGGWVTYSIPANKVVKIPCPRENTILGNQVALKAYNKSYSGQGVPGPNTDSVVARVKYAESPVDVKANIILDSSLDD